MKQNNIETAREFYESRMDKYKFVPMIDIMVAYATYLTATDSDGQKSAEIILQEQKDKFPYNWGRNAEDMAAYVPNEIALKAMHEFAAQSRPQLTDEEIIKEAGNIIAWKHREIIQDYFKIGAKWARTKLTGK